MQKRDGSRPVDIKLLIGAASLIAALLAVWASVGSGGSDTDAASTPTSVVAASPETTVTPAEPVAPTTLLPMNTTVPFHPLPNPEDWRTWLKVNGDAFSKAKEQLAAGLITGGSGDVADEEDIATWSAALLAAPIPADPIGQRLTASMSAFSEWARPAPANSTKTPATAVDENQIKAYTLLQTAVAELEQLGVLPTP